MEVVAVVGLELDTWSLVTGLMRDLEVGLEKGDLVIMWRDWWIVGVAVAVVGDRIGVVVAVAVAMALVYLFILQMDG